MHDYIKSEYWNLNLILHSIYEPVSVGWCGKLSTLNKNFRILRTWIFTIRATFFQIWQQLLGSCNNMWKYSTSIVHKNLCLKRPFQRYFKQTNKYLASTLFVLFTVKSTVVHFKSTRQNPISPITALQEEHSATAPEISGFTVMQPRDCPVKINRTYAWPPLLQLTQKDNQMFNQCCLQVCYLESS